MNTLEMINDWKESGYKQKYLTKNNGNLPYTARNNGVGVLFCSYFVITIKDPIPKSNPFVISNSNLDWEWEPIISEYNITQAFDKTEKGDCMISLASGSVLKLENKFTQEEIRGIWIEKMPYKRNLEE